MLKPAENIALSLVLVCTLAVLTSCSSNKYLSPGESFLEENSTTIRSKDRIKNKRVLQADLEQLYVQKETRTWAGIPRHTFYYAALKKPDDTTGIQKWLRKRGDPPVILDSSSINSTIVNMTLLLRQHGYWNGDVDYSVHIDRKRSRVNYLVDPKQRWTVASLKYVSRDKTVQRILDTLILESLLAPGEPVDVDLYEAEKARITLALQNRGYANFFQNYITEPIADSSNHTMHLEIEVTTPFDSDTHVKYTVGDIIVYPDATDVDSTHRDTVIDGVTFLMLADRPVVRPEIIARNIFLKRGELYSRDAYDKTQRQLGRLEMYRFISLKPVLDSEDSTRLDFRLSLARNKKMAIGGDIELSYSTLAQRSLMGISGNINYRNRNLLRGAELFLTNIEAGVEFNLENKEINSLNFNVQNNLLIPKFIDPIGFYSLLNHVRLGKDGLLGDKIFNWLTEGNSSVGAGYQFLSLFNLYEYHSLTVSLGYDAQPDARRRLQLNHVGLDYFNPTTKPGLDTILIKNVFLRESFRKQLFSGFLFRDYRFSYSGVPRPLGISVNVIHSAEVSGLEIFGINTLYNALADETGGFQLGKDNPLAFSQFAKFEIDTRLHYNPASNQQLAFRLATGLAFPYGPFSSQVPYIKQFYVGGPSSIRAWQIRELGPGGYEDPSVNPNNDLPFYQTGDIKLDLSAEYRFDLFWVFKGTVFLDAGNVWTIQDDAGRPGAVFSRNFIKQMAVGTGLGLRMDFTYFLIRLDFGYKLRNPYPVDGKYWQFDNFKDFSFRQFNTNFAIGYPF
ncbi:MAG TPA: BamA/TamA family outer membrane protein [Saprospiraceae bacterium]|nr:BamA/TamA family outer membrane protein [Saprospiraceae bacterium]